MKKSPNSYRSAPINEPVHAAKCSASAQNLTYVPIPRMAAESACPPEKSYINRRLATQRGLNSFEQSSIRSRMSFLVLLVVAMLTVTHSALVPSDDTYGKLLDPGPLLKRCPCVPINTCYSQGVSLNEQEFLNSRFQCPDYTQNHCCGPYFPTLGSSSGDFYFEEEVLRDGGGTGRVMIVMAQNATTADPLEVKVVTVLPEVTTTVDLGTSTEETITTSTVVPEEFSTTTEVNELETEVTTTSEEPSTTQIVLSTTVKPEVRLGKLYYRGRYTSVFNRYFTTTARSAAPTTVSSSSFKPRRIYPTRSTLHNAEFRQRYTSGRQRNRTSTTPTTSTSSPLFRRPDA